MVRVRYHPACANPLINQSASATVKLNMTQNIWLVKTKKSCKELSYQDFTKILSWVCGRQKRIIFKCCKKKNINEQLLAVKKRKNNNNFSQPTGNLRSHWGCLIVLLQMCYAKLPHDQKSSLLMDLINLFLHVAVMWVVRNTRWHLYGP